MQRVLMTLLPTLLLAAMACHLSPEVLAYPADVENLPPDRYFEVTLNEIQQAKSSIRLTMYLVSLPANRIGSKVYRLVDALVEAQERGVDVQVVLDRNIDWTPGNSPGFWDPEWKNWKAYQYLRKCGVNAFFDSTAVFTHAKLLVIDEETVILGSANWSESGITRNLEATALIHSREFAKGILKDFEALELLAPPLQEEPAVAVPWIFLNDPESLGKMVTSHDEAAFDAYLYLLKVARGNKEERIALAYEPLIRELGFKSKTYLLNKRSVRKVLQRLQEKYGLIEYAYQWGQQPRVSFRDLGKWEKQQQFSKPRFVQVPLTYWTWGWNRKLTFSGKVMYLLGNLYATLSPIEPVWFRSQEAMAQRHGFSRYFAQAGLMNLRRNNLLEVKPDELSPKDFSDRKANRYVLNSLYDPNRFKDALEELEQRYGKGKVQRALGYAASVYEDSDLEAVKRLILLEEEFGQEVVQRAAEKLSSMSGSNPKKTVGYLIGTIQGIGGIEG